MRLLLAAALQGSPQVYTWRVPEGAWCSSRGSPSAGRSSITKKIENYPGFSQGIAGSQLVTEMVEQAVNAGLQLECNEVVEVENFSSCRSVSCRDGRNYTAPIVIIAGGAHPKNLNVPGEEKLKGKGVFHCAFCDGGQFAGKVVASAAAATPASAGHLSDATVQQSLRD